MGRTSERGELSTPSRHISFLILFPSTLNDHFVYSLLSQRTLSTILVRSGIRALSLSVVVYAARKYIGNPREGVRRISRFGDREGREAKSKKKRERGGRKRKKETERE